jgi:hypothetical protein
LFQEPNYSSISRREISRKLAGEKLSTALSILKRLNIHDATEGFILFLLEELPHPREEF